MTKVKYDVTGVEDADFDTPVPVGVYDAVIESVKEKVSKRSNNPMLEICYKITKGPFKGRMIWDYITLTDAQSWRLKMFVKALGLKTKGAFDTRKITGSKVKIRVKHEGSEDDDYGISAKIRTVLSPDSDAASKVTNEDDDDYEDEEIEDEEEEDEEEGEEEDEEEDEEEEGTTTDDYTWDDLADYTRDDLKALIEDEELEIKVGRKGEDKLRLEIAEALGVDAEEDEEDDEDDEPEYESMKLAELKKIAKEKGVRPEGSKRALVKRLEKADKDGPF